MSLCRAHGHQEPESYPLGLLYDEVGLIEEREGQRMVTEAALRQGLLASMFGGRGSKSAFQKQAKKATVRTKPRKGIFG